MSRWTTEELSNSLAAAFGAANVEEIPTADGAVQVVLPELGDLGITIALTDHQLFVSTPLVDAGQVHDRAAFDNACMRLNPINPLLPRTRRGRPGPLSQRRQHPAGAGSAGPDQGDHRCIVIDATPPHECR